MQLTRRSFIAATLAVSASPAFSATSQVLSGPAFGTAWRLVLPVGTAPDPVRTAILRVIEMVNRAMSPYRTTSELWQFNQPSVTGWVDMPEPCCDVIAQSLIISDQTGGIFDPTVGPIVNWFGFGPIEGTAAPGPAGLKVRLGAVLKPHAGLTIDLCGIAKGYALDRIVRELRRSGNPDFLIELGGEVMAHGHHPSGRRWQVGIERPGSSPLTFEHVLELDGLALATSGWSHQGYGADGRQISHIIDPRLGRPIAGNLLSVSVLADTAMSADGWATALMALGGKDGPALARRKGIASLFILREGTGSNVVTTGNFAENLVV